MKFFGLLFFFYGCSILAVSPTGQTEMSFNWSVAFFTGPGALIFVLPHVSGLVLAAAETTLLGTSTTARNNDETH